MSQPDPSSMSRRAQFRETYRITKEQDPSIGLKLLGTFLAGAVVGFVVFWLLPGNGVVGTVIAIVGALLVGIVATLVVFSRRAQKSAYARIEGQPGAAYAALNMLRRGWTTSQAVAVEPRSQTMVHRVVGPPGVILVGEGSSPNRVRSLLASTRTKHARVLPETPIHEIVVGNGEGEVPLPKLSRRVMKLRRAVQPAEITDVLNRLKALDNTRGNLPIPKGPIPTSMKGLRGNLRGR
ncbi:MAG: DUF4191 domain-containing protein [Nocardioides sp.]|uniref:DUF4191 domain-containing protein n=1 Tax=Nocardioides sp. TaxID=35761 RepID=UPI0039E286A6